MLAELDVADSEVIPQKRGRGRPSVWSDEKAEAIVDAVAKGMSPTRAGHKLGINHATIGEWRAIYPEFSTSLDQAEAEYVAKCIADLEACETKWGTPDPKAIEIKVRRFPEFRQHQEIETRSTELRVSVVVAPEQLASLQAMWAASLGGQE